MGVPKIFEKLDWAKSISSFFLVLGPDALDSDVLKDKV